MHFPLGPAAELARVGETDLHLTHRVVLGQVLIEACQRQLLQLCRPSMLVARSWSRTLVLDHNVVDLVDPLWIQRLCLHVCLRHLELVDLQPSRKARSCAATDFDLDVWIGGRLRKQIPVLGNQIAASVNLHRQSPALPRI